MKYSLFQPSSKKDWLDKVEKDLKGKPLSGLDWEYLQGKSVSPFGHQNDRKVNYGSLNSGKLQNDWKISQSISVKDAEKANKMALQVLEQGAEALTFVLPESKAQTNWDALLKDIHLDWISLEISAQNGNIELINEFLAFAQKQSAPLEQLDISFDLPATSIPKNAEEIENFKDHCSALPKAKMFSINASQLGNNSNKIEGLANSLRAANTFIERLFDGGVNPEEHLHRIKFITTLSNNYYLNIAEIRALRILWSQLQEAWQVEAAVPAFIKAGLESSSLTEDADSNLIYATSQALSAIIAGVDQLNTSLHAEANNDSQLLDLRISQNIQHILKMESYMDRVIDPAAGSYYLEGLTEQIAEQAWNSFQQHPTLNINS